MAEVSLIYFVVGIPVFYLLTNKLSSARASFLVEIIEYLLLYVLWLPVMFVYGIVYIVLSLANSLSK